VLAGHPVTLALTHALVQGTPHRVAAAWPVGLAWAELGEFARAPAPGWVASMRSVSAVVTLRHAARGDPLYAAARAHAPRVVEIDASVDADRATPVVRLRPEDTGPGFALGPANAMRLAERIASDLSALHPAEAPRFAATLRALKERLLRLKAAHDAAFAGVAAPEVAAATEAFDALCAEFGVQVVARLASDAAGWSAAERERQLAALRGAGVRVSVHAAPPGPELAAVLRDAGVEPVVLDPLTRSVDDPEAAFRVLESNLVALRTALERAADR